MAIAIAVTVMALLVLFMVYAIAVSAMETGRRAGYETGYWDAKNGKPYRPVR